MVLQLLLLVRTGLLQIWRLGCCQDASSIKTLNSHTKFKLVAIKVIIFISCYMYQQLLHNVNFIIFESRMQQHNKLIQINISCYICTQYMVQNSLRTFWHIIFMLSHDTNFPPLEYHACLYYTHVHILHNLKQYSQKNYILFSS